MKVIKSILLFTTSVLALFLSVNNYATSMQNERNWNFQVYLDDTPIGYHYFNLIQNNKERQLISKAKFDVKFLFVSVYNYKHENIEKWNGECLTSLSSTTNTNGENHFVNLRNNDQQSIVETTRGRQVFDHCIKSFAYWDPKLLNSGQAINAQTGDLVDIQLNLIGTETFKLNNQSINSKRYHLKANNMDIDLWYTKNNTWLALRSKTRDGKNIHYKLQGAITQ